MKKIVCLVLSLALVFCMLAACADSTGTQSSTPGSQNSTSGTQPSDSQGSQTNEPELEHYKIAVANFSTDATALLIKTYYENYLAPAFNVEFVYSEGLGAAEEIMDFIDSAYAAGCDGIINFTQDSVDQVVEKCNDLGLYIVTDTTTPGVNNDGTEYPYNLGYLGADTARSAADFSVLVKNLVDDGNDHNIVVLSGGAGLGKANDYACTVSALETLRDFYGLTFEKDINDLAAVRAETECVNDSDVKITIYPGYANTDTYVPGLSALLQSGDYDIILCNSTAFAQVSNAIDEVEREFGINIKITAKAQVNDTMKNSFETLDSFGDTFLTSAQLTPTLSTAGCLFAVMYNGISGHGDVVRKDGQAAAFDTPKWVVPSAEDYKRITQLNVSDDTWELSVDDLKEMIAIYNPNVNYDTLFEFIQSTGDLDFILGLRGLK